MTVLAPVATLLYPGDHQGDYLRAAGRAALHSEIEVRDEQGRPVPTGTVGEICVRGSHVMQDYWNKPEESAAAIKGSWMHTGDGGYVDEHGYVFVVDLR